MPYNINFLNSQGEKIRIGGVFDVFIPKIDNIFWNIAFGKDKDIKELNNISGHKSILILETAISNIDECKFNSVYSSTAKNNLKASLIDLLNLAKEKPFGVWKVDLHP